MFTHIKYQSRILMRRKTLIATLLFVARIPPLAGGILSLFALSGCIVYGAAEITGFAVLDDIWYKIAFYVFLIFACLFFPVFYSAVSFAARSYFERFAANGCRPGIFFTFRQALRYFRYSLFKLLYTLLWAVLLFLPAAGSAGVLLALLYNGEVYLPVFICLCLCSGVLLAVGLCFFFAALTRYFLCEYLLCQNPKMPVRDVIAESVFLMHGHARKTIVFFISFIPWMVVGMIPFFFPFVYTFIKTSCVKLSARYFGENEIKCKRGSAIVYYINAKTRFFEHTDTQTGAAT